MWRLQFNINRLYTHLDRIKQRERRMLRVHVRQACLVSVLQLIGEPVKSLVKAISGSGASCLDVPITVTQGVEAKLVSDFRGVHCIWQVLFVSEDQQNSVAQLVLGQHSHQLLSCFSHTLSIIAVNDEDQALRVLEVMTPQWTDLVLTTDVPNCEGDVLVFDSLDVETDRWNRGDDFAELQLVQDRCFTSSIKSDHQDTHFSFAEEALKQACENVAHICN
jgi:hypothetical protein